MLPVMMLVQNTVYQGVVKELVLTQAAPWPSSSSSSYNHQDPDPTSTNYRSTPTSSTTPPSSSSAPIRFTALHVTMIFIAILLCVVVCAIPWDNIKCSSNSSEDARHEHRDQSQQHNQNEAAESGAGVGDEEDGRQSGLSKKMIRSLQSVRYGASSLREKAGEGGAGSCWSECMICLGEFRNGQMIRVLPRCAHGFHKKCIDQWLLSHTSCPICRDVLLLLDSPGKPSTITTARTAARAQHGPVPGDSGLELMSPPSENPIVVDEEDGDEHHQSGLYRSYAVVVSD